VNSKPSSEIDVAPPMAFIWNENYAWSRPRSQPYFFKRMHLYK
jgi:hypothetical protein